MKIAFASNDGIVINQHFGHTPAFWIAEIKEENEEWCMEGKRDNFPSCKYGEHDENSIRSSIELISDCKAVFVVQAGNYVQHLLQQNGIQVLEIKGLIDEVINSYIAYLRKVHYFDKVRTILSHQL